MTDSNHSEQQDTQKKKMSLQEAMKQQLENKKNQAAAGNSNAQSLQSTKKMKSQQDEKSEQLSEKNGCVMNGQNRKDITPGTSVAIVLKADQRTGKLTRGIVKDILTNSSVHPRGIKVETIDGQVGRVQEIT